MLFRSTNKVKFLDRFALFHAVDSSRLGDAIVAQGRKQGRVFDVLLEVNVSGEESKGGFAPEDIRREADRLLAVMAAGGGKAAGGIRVVGAMTMAPFEADEATLRQDGIERLALWLHAPGAWLWRLTVGTVIVAWLANLSTWLAVAGSFSYWRDSARRSISVSG